jgi:hypothetical protein
MRNSDIFRERNISMEPLFPSDFLDKLQPEPERCDIEVSSAVWYDSLAGRGVLDPH